MPREHPGARGQQTCAQPVHVLPAEGGQGPRRGQRAPAADARRRTKSVRRVVQEISRGGCRVPRAGRHWLNTRHPVPGTQPMHFLLAVISGFLFALAFPNYAIGWLIFIALIPLFIALARAKSWREAFALGWISQTIAWLLMVPWVVRVMSHYGGLPYVTGVLIFVAMCIILGFYGGAFGVLVFRIAPSDEFRRWLLVPLAWAAIEYARTYLLTGFPWNLIAAAIVDYTPLAQFDRVAGPYALAVLILIPAATISWMIVARPRGMRLVAVVAPVTILCFVWWSTGLVASKLIPRPRVGPTYTAALLQPNISQEM